MMEKLRKNKRGVVMFYISFFIMAIIIITIGAVLAPAGVLFNSKMYEMGEDIMLQANDSISQINDAEVRGALGNVTTKALLATETNIETNANIFRYSWVFLIAIAGLVMFIITRQTIELGGGGFT